MINTEQSPLDELLAFQDDPTINSRILEVENLVTAAFPTLPSQNRDIVTAVVIPSGEQEIIGSQPVSSSSKEKCRRIQSDITSFIQDQRKRLNLPPATIQIPEPRENDGHIRWMVVVSVSKNEMEKKRSAK